MSGNFIDSNIVLYTLDEADAAKHRIAISLMEQCVYDGTATISFQVVQEVLNAVMRKFSPPFDADRAQSLLDRVLVPIWRVSPSQSLYELGIDLHRQYRYSFFDCLILAAAISSGCTRLYTEDLQAGQHIGRLTIVNPFA